MKQRIRQIALVARELEPVADDLCAVFGVEVAHRDPGVGVFGLENVVIPFGKTFLEVVCPTREGTTAGRLLDRRGGDGGYMVIVQPDAPDLSEARERMKALNIRIAWEVTLDDIASIHLHPRDVGGAILSIDVTAPWDAWRWAGPSWTDAIRTDVVRSIRGAEVEAIDPDSMARRWAGALACDDPATDGANRLLAVGESRVRFVPAGDRGEGVSGVDVEVADRNHVLESAKRRKLEHGDDWVNVCGTRFRLV